MTKIISSVLVVLVLGSVVLSGTLALFSDQATIEGLHVSAGNADIELGYYTGPTTHGYETDDLLDMSALNLFTNLYPGFETASDLQAVDLWVRNVSTSNFSVNPTMQMTSVTTGWGTELSYAVQLKLKFDNGAGTGADTGWMSLPQWNAGAVQLPGGTLAHNAEARYFIYVRVPLTYGYQEGGYNGGPAKDSVVGNEISGQSLTGGVFTVTGTQVP